jgi:hypothetical protein
MSIADLDAALRAQIERDVAEWPALSPEQESAVGVIFASAKAMQESGPTAA